MKDNNVVKYDTPQGEITLSPDIVKRYLVSGQGKVTDQEVVMFLQLCKYQKLNPFLREAYLIKYSDRSPATMVTGKETFLKRAQRNPRYQGHKTGISHDGASAWAEVYMEGYKVPIKVEIDYKEYVALKDGKPNHIWATKRNTMMKKVALVQALREAMPEDLGGMYSPEEINTLHEELPEDEIKVEDDEVKHIKDAFNGEIVEEKDHHFLEKMKTFIPIIGKEEFSKKVEALTGVKLKVLGDVYKIPAKDRDSIIKDFEKHMKLIKEEASA